MKFGVFCCYFPPESVKSYPNSKRGGGVKTNAVFDVIYFSPGEVTLERRGREDSGLGFFSLIFPWCWESRNI